MDYRSERGIALVKVLFMTTILLGISAYAARSTRVEVRIAQNEYLQKRALQIAEAGLDRAWRKVEQNLAGGSTLTAELGNNPGFMGSVSGSSNVTLTDGVYMSVPFSGGDYRVRLFNNSDETVTPSTDVDGKIVIHSIGNVGGSSREIKALLEQSHAFDEGLFAKYDLNISGTGSDRVSTDSYRSSQGPYASQTPGEEGNIGSNGDISNNGQPEVHGSATAGGNVTLTPDATGGETSGAPQTALPPVTPCNQTTGYSPGTGIAGVQGNSLRASGQTIIYLPPQGSAPGTYTYCFQNVSLSGANTALVITQPVILNVTGYVDLGGNGVMNQAPTNGGAPLPSNLQIYSSCVGTCGGGSAGVKLAGGSQAAFVVYAPEATVQFQSNGGDIYGAVVGGSISMGGGVNFHYDEDLAGFGPTTTALVGWREIRN